MKKFDLKKWIIENKHKGDNQENSNKKNLKKINIHESKGKSKPKVNESIINEIKKAIKNLKEQNNINVRRGKKGKSFIRPKSRPHAGSPHGHGELDGPRITPSDQPMSIAGYTPFVEKKNTPIHDVPDPKDRPDLAFNPFPGSMGGMTEREKEEIEKFEKERTPHSGYGDVMPEYKNRRRKKMRFTPKRQNHNQGADLGEYKKHYRGTPRDPGWKAPDTRYGEHPSYGGPDINERDITPYPKKDNLGPGEPDSWGDYDIDNPNTVTVTGYGRPTQNLSNRGPRINEKEFVKPGDKNPYDWQSAHAGIGSLSPGGGTDADDYGAWSPTQNQPNRGPQRIDLTNINGNTNNGNKKSIKRKFNQKRRRPNRRR